jgi:hypothetical protein
MRISKLLSAVCATAFLAGSASVRAQDTPEQAAARAALIEKMSELDTQQSQPTNAPPTTPPPAAPAPAEAQPAPAAPAVPDTNTPPAAVPAPAEAPAPAPAETQPAPVAAAVPGTTPPVVVVTTNGAEQEQTVQPTNAMATPPPASMPAEAQPPAPVTMVPETNSQPSVALMPPPVVAATPPAKPVAPVASPIPANAGNTGVAMGFKPIEAPPLPISAQKEAELQALLAKYMADQVSPDEYQKERAAILAEP